MSGSTNFVDGNILFAQQLNTLKALIPTKTSQLNNDAAFVSSISGLVTSVAGRSGSVVLQASDINGLKPIATSGAYSDLTGTPTVPNNTSQLTNGAGFITASAISGLAPLASPVFTGSPTAPTPTSSDNSTKLATTNYVTVALQNFATQSSSGTVSLVTSTTNAITIANGSTAPALTFNPGNVNISSFINDAGYGNSTGTSVNARVITTSGDVTMTSTDRMIGMNKTIAAATQVTLPASPTLGRIASIKDVKGDAGTNHITIVAASGTIDGAANKIIDTNYASVDLMYFGTGWGVI